MTKLEVYIQSYFGVARDDLSQISTYFQPLSLRKGDYFLKTGRHADRLGFLHAGLIREYVDSGDKEITKWIASEGGFVVDLSSFLFGQPARWNIQALTDCELFVIDKNHYEQIGQRILKWPQLEKLFIAKCFTVMEDRIMTHLSMSAEERYQNLFAYNPDLFNQVPLQYLASMLGITPETMSRIRKKMLG